MVGSETALRPVKTLRAVGPNDVLFKFERRFALIN